MLNRAVRNACLKCTASREETTTNFMASRFKGKSRREKGNSRRFSWGRDLGLEEHQAWWKILKTRKVGGEPPWRLKLRQERKELRGGRLSL